MSDVNGVSDVTAVQCPHATECAGCPAIDAPYDEQLRAKGERVDRALARFSALSSVRREDVRGATPIERYRTRVKLVVDGTRIGLFAREGDHVVVDIPGCRVMSETTASAVALLRTRLGESAALARALVAIDLRDVHTDEGSKLLLTLVLDESTPVATEAEARRLHTLAREAGVPIATVATSTRPSRSPQLLGRGLRVVSGPDAVDERLAAPRGRHVSIPAMPGGFVQAHHPQAAALRAELVAGLERRGVGIEGARVIDAYAGSGALGLGLAAAGARVLLIESYAPAMELARQSARVQKLAAKAVAADASEALAELSRRGDRPDVIVLNPPRRGVAPEVREAAVALAPKCIAYVSCEPDTLARDLDHLACLGYATESLTPFDLIPLSREVESLVLLVPKAPSALVVLARRDDLVALDRGAWEGPRSETLLRRARDASGFPHGVLLGPTGASGLLLVARDAEAARRWSSVALEASWELLTRGILRPKGSVNRAVGGTDARTRYRRTAIVGGQSRVTARCDSLALEVPLTHLRELGHPVLGDPRGHAPSNRHFVEQHGLDRPFVHLASITLGDFVATSALSGDLATVLARAGG
ncbi:MAG: RsmD family RNA methyltransferase [Sandaracinus sp.]|nr:RsmD family RNA methyltransferase [Sandaracinus sp.]